MGQEWNYFQCNECYVMFPHLKVPRICICGNNLDVSSTRKKFFLSFMIKEILKEWEDKIKKDEEGSGFEEYYDLRIGELKKKFGFEVSSE